MVANDRARAEMAERLQACVALHKSERQIQHLSGKLLKAQEVERKRIAMELHDELGQDLNAMKLQIRVMERGLKADQERAELNASLPGIAQGQVTGVAPSQEDVDKEKLARTFVAPPPEEETTRSFIDQAIQDRARRNKEGLSSQVDAHDVDKGVQTTDLAQDLMNFFSPIQSLTVTKLDNRIDPDVVSPTTSKTHIGFSPGKALGLASTIGGFGLPGAIAAGALSHTVGTIGLPSPSLQSQIDDKGIFGGVPGKVAAGVIGAGLSAAGIPGLSQAVGFGFDQSGLKDDVDAAFGYEHGGLIGPAGMPVRPTKSYEEGGMITPNGQPQAQPAGLQQPQQQQAPMGLGPIQQHVEQFAQQQPQEMMQIKQAMMQALQSGELTPQELNMVVQLATAAAQNPQVYPQIRQFAIQQGLASEEDLSPQYDEGLVVVLLTAAKSVQAEMSGQAPVAPGRPMAQGQRPVAGLEKGGSLPADSKNADGSIPITAHEGEYVIPERVVRAKGTDFFDKMIEDPNEQTKTS